MYTDGMTFCCHTATPSPAVYVFYSWLFYNVDTESIMIFQFPPNSQWLQRITNIVCHGYSRNTKEKTQMQTWDMEGIKNTKSF